jgi:hypothetical protein
MVLGRGGEAKRDGSGMDKQRDDVQVMRLRLAQESAGSVVMALST